MIEKAKPKWPPDIPCPEASPVDLGNKFGAFLGSQFIDKTPHVLTSNPQIKVISITKKGVTYVHKETQGKCTFNF